MRSDEDADIERPKRHPSQAKHAAHVARDGGYSSRVLEPSIYPSGSPQGERLGYIGIEICETCAFIVLVECPHENNTWNEDGTVLSCSVCGADVT